MFGKIFDQSFDSSIAANYEVRHVFWDLIVLADSQGVVDMTYDAIARRTNVPIDKVIACMGELMQPDPASRSTKNEGARIALLDSHRDWGWQIVNYGHYRNLRDQESRKSYFRDKMRESRARKRTAVKPVKDQADSTRENNSQPLNGVKPVKPGEALLTHGEGEEEVVPPSVPQGGLDFDQAKAFLQNLFGREKRAWSFEEQELLSKIVPISAADAGLLTAWYRLPADHPVFEKTKARTQIVTLLRDFYSELDKIRRFAPLFIKKAGPAKSAEPPRWQEFFRWKNGDEVVLPRYFHLLSREHQAEYERDFQTFVSAMAHGQSEAGRAVGATAPGEGGR